MAHSANYIFTYLIKEREANCLKIGGELSGANCQGGELSGYPLIYVSVMDEGKVDLSQTRFTLEEIVPDS